MELQSENSMTVARAAGKGTLAGINFYSTHSIVGYIGIEIPGAALR
jgi:hypothetical protein